MKGTEEYKEYENLKNKQNVEEDVDHHNTHIEKLIKMQENKFHIPKLVAFIIGIVISIVII